jgi:hypothetical protein
LPGLKQKASEQSEAFLFSWGRLAACAGLVGPLLGERSEP